MKRLLIALLLVASVGLAMSPIAVSNGNGIVTARGSANGLLGSDEISSIKTYRVSLSQTVTKELSSICSFTVPVYISFYSPQAYWFAESGVASASVQDSNKVPAGSFWGFSPSYATQSIAIISDPSAVASLTVTVWTK